MRMLKGSLSRHQLIGFFAIIVGMFMSILDIQIVASSLSVIGAGLLAGQDELSWVQTAYLIAEVIVIPICGFLTGTFSTRITYFVACVGFTIMSIFCAMSWNIQSMIIFRALQGIFGGMMIPIPFAIVFILFRTKQQRSQATVAIGLVVTIAPTLGPILGGYLTNITSWHVMFLLNVIPGIFVSWGVWGYVDVDKPNYSLLKNFDYLGLSLLAISLGGLQYVLEEGNKKGWGDSLLILGIIIVVSISFVMLFIREINFSNPILDFSAFKDRNFSVGCIYSFILGTGLFGAIYLLPIFLYTIAGMTSLQIGLIMMVTGIFQFLSSPIAGYLSGSNIDQRIMLFIGLILFSLGCYYNSKLTLDSRFWELFLPQALRGASLMFCFIPISNLSLGTIPTNKIASASGFFNLMRNLGGAIGLAIINTSIVNQTKVYTQVLANNISNTGYQSTYMFPKFSLLLSNISLIPEQLVLIFTAKCIQQNAFIIAINDIFLAISLLFILVLILLPLLKNKIQKDVSVH